MSLESGGVIGQQRPRVELAPPGDSSDADDAQFLSGEYGLKPFEWQHYTLQGWLARRPNGLYAAPTCGLSVPRQNGKNAVIEMRELIGTVLLGERIIHTAHQLKTVKHAFRRLSSFFTDRRYPELARMVKTIRESNGQEGIYLTNGASVEFISRSRNSGKGFTGDVLVIDEAQESKEEHLASLQPTISAGPLGNPQMIMLGTPPSPNAGEPFRRLRDAAMSSGERLCWHEWSVGRESDPDDPLTIAQANPSLGLRLSMEACLAERATSSDEDFWVQRLGSWDVLAQKNIIPIAFWNRAIDYEVEPVDHLALGIQVAPDAVYASVVLAGMLDDGRWHVALVETATGADWVAPFVGRLLAKNPKLRAVVSDVGSPSRLISDALAGQGVRPMEPKVIEVGEASVKFLDAIVTGQLKHRGSLQMTTAIQSASKRKLGTTGLWAFSPANSAADVTSVQAAALALWGAQHPRPTRPLGRAVRARESTEEYDEAGRFVAW